jgi:excisionase family DNA binding protein
VSGSKITDSAHEVALMGVDEAARLLGTSPRFIRRLVQDRRIAYYKLGGHVRLSKADLIGFIADGRIEVDR